MDPIIDSDLAILKLVDRRKKKIEITSRKFYVTENLWLLDLRLESRR